MSEQNLFTKQETMTRVCDQLARNAERAALALTQERGAMDRGYVRDLATAAHALSEAHYHENFEPFLALGYGGALDASVRKHFPAK